jgi:hypothetical protein
MHDTLRLFRNIVVDFRFEFRFSLIIAWWQGYSQPSATPILGGRGFSQPVCLICRKPPVITQLTGLKSVFRRRL